MAKMTKGNVIIQFTVYTTSEWESHKSAVLPKGLPAFEALDDGKTKVKVGDGVKTWENLPYIGGDEYVLTKENIIAALEFTPADQAKVGVAGGIASLDAQGKVPANQLPSFVNAIIEVADITQEGDGEEGKIYVDLKTDKTYRWSGTRYTEISASDIVTKSDQNGYIKVNGQQVQVYDLAQDMDSELSAESEKPVKNSVLKAEFDKKVNQADEWILNVGITAAN